MATTRNVAPDFGLATIVVPAYNVEKYIRECLESLVSQTYKNIEILVVDDGSTDGTKRIADNMADCDSRIQVFHTSNHGVSFSRNLAIDSGEGDFLLFVDADDVVSSDFVETLVRPLAAGTCDCSAVGIAAYRGGELRFSSGDLSTYSGDEKYQALFGACRGFICNKGFRYSTIRAKHIRLQETIAQSEDMLFLLEYLPHANTLSFDSATKYFYRMRSGSATVSLANPKWFDVLVVYGKFLSSFEGKPELLHAVKASFLPIAYEGLYRYKVSKINNSVLYSSLLTMRDECEECLPGCSLSYRFKMSLFRHLTVLVMRRRLRGAS